MLPCVLVAPKKKRRKTKKKKSRKKKRTKRSKREALAKIKRGGKLLGDAIALVAGTSILWAGVYRVANPPWTLTMLERKLGGDDIKHPWTSIDDISPHLVRAVIAAEDTRFCLHDGIDMRAIKRAVDEKRGGKRLRGASTISQQTAKNAFLWNGGGWLRKGGEAWMTVTIETLWPKRRVMEVYLNIAEWGDGNFGAAAAAKARFGKTALELSEQEAALLASVLPSPNKWRADTPGPYVRSRAAKLRKRMVEVQRSGLDACVLPLKGTS